MENVKSLRRETEEVQILKQEEVSEQSNASVERTIGLVSECLDMNKVVMDDAITALSFLIAAAFKDSGFSRESYTKVMRNFEQHYGEEMWP